jgi:hypothetical protein
MSDELCSVFLRAEFKASFSDEFDINENLCIKFIKYNTQYGTRLSPSKEHATKFIVYR